MGKQLLFNLDDSPPANVAAQQLSESSQLLFLPAAQRELGVREPAKQNISQLRKKLGLGSSLATRTVASILAGRAPTQDADLEGFLSPSLTHLPDPSRMKGFDRGVEVILTAIRTSHTIGIVGDYDVDGITSVAQFVNTLQSAAAPHKYWIPNRFKDGYGISDRIVQEIIDSGCKVAVLFDNGTNAHKQIARLRDHNIEVVVFDHHEVGDSIPDCILVNHKQPGCGFHDESPSAAGLSALLNRQLQISLGLRHSDMSLAALGTIADMVPLQGLNRTLARIGLADMRRNSNIGISALARRYWVAHDDINSGDIGFLIGPALNAAGRLGDGSAGFDAALCVELLTTSDQDRAKAIADILFSVNNSRKGLQRELVLDNYARLARQATLPAVLVAFSENHHPGLNGLVAQGLASRYARPAFVFSQNKDGSYTGSARNGHESFDLMHIIRAAQATDQRNVIVRAGGHKAAAGVTISPGSLDTFQAVVTDVFQKHYLAQTARVQLVADAKLRIADLTPSFVSQVDALLEPYGQGFSAPQYLFEDVTVRRIEEYDGGRYMLELEQDGTQRTIRSFIGPEIWNGDIRVGATLSIIAAPAQIYRNQKRYVQLSVSGYTVTRVPDTRTTTSPDTTALKLFDFTFTHEPSAVHEPEESQNTEQAEDVAFETPHAPEESETQDAVPLDFLEHIAWHTRGDESFEPPPHRKPFKKSRFNTLKERLQTATGNFDSRYIYPELEGLAPDFFCPLSEEENQRLWNKLLERCDLAIYPHGLEYRPWCEEFIRYFFERPGNHVLQAPTGTGKTEIALSIASHYRKHGKRVIMLAPTIDIVRDLSRRIKRLLHEDAVVLDGGLTSPGERTEIYTSNPGFIVATPHVISNDLKNGLLSFGESDLLIVDEAHQATGKASPVTAIKSARAATTRILGLSATPAQVLSGKSWVKLKDLQSTFDVAGIFPLNVPTRRPEIRVRYLSLPEEMKQAEALLVEAARALQQRSLEYLGTHGSNELSAQAVKLFGTAEVLFPSPYALKPLLKQLREMPDFKDWGIYHTVRAIGELSDLRHALVKHGVAAFLLRCIEKRFEVNYPTHMPKGLKRPLAPAHLSPVYTSRNVESAYNLLARGIAIGLWSHHEHRRIIGIDDRQAWNTLSPAARRSASNKALSQTRKRVMEDLAALQFCNHPKEEYLLNKLGENTKRSFVSARLIDHAVFLTKRIDQHVPTREGKVITLTGIGRGIRKGVSRGARKSNLAAFNSGAASVIVGTSAAGLGIDIVADYGCTLDFDGWTNARQKEGRVGRRSFGLFEYLCTTLDEVAKVNHILYKDVLFQEMLNEQRAAITADAGLPPKLCSSSTTRDTKLSTGWLFS